jgi:hypothetical protein
MKMLDNNRRIVLWTIVVVMVVLVLACGESTSTAETTVRTATPTAESVAADEDVGQVAEPDEPADVEQEPSPTPTEVETPTELYLGDAVSEHGYALCAIEVEDPAPHGMFYTEQPGKKLVTVRLVVGNIAGDPHTVNPLNAVLIDDDGLTYDLELAGRDSQMATAGINHGEKIEGWVAFSIDEGATPTALRYNFGGLFGNETVRVSLVPPPEGYSPSSDVLDVTPEVPDAKLGDLAVASGVSLSAVSVEDPTAPSMLYSEEEGHKLVAVEIVVGNEGDEAISVNPLYAYLVDDRGYVYGLDLASIEKDQLATVDVDAGEKVKGWVGFTIPEAATPAAVKYQLSALSNDYVRVGLAP